MTYRGSNPPFKQRMITLACPDCSGSGFFGGNGPEVDSLCHCENGQIVLFDDMDDNECLNALGQEKRHLYER